MRTSHSPRKAVSVLRLLALVVIAGAVAYACNGGDGPTSPATPATGPAGGTAGADLIDTTGEHIDIEKATNGEDADEAMGPQIAVGDPVTWTYVVTNTGSLPVIGIAVTDDRVGVIGCPHTTLASGKSMTCTASGVAEEGPYRNVAVVTGTTSQGQEVIDEDASHYFGIIPGVARVDIEKATNGEDADQETGPEIVIGDPITWTYRVTNLGDVPLTNVVVSDDQLGVITCPESSLAAGQSMTCTAEGVAIEGQYRNVGSVTATGAENEEVGDEDASHYIGVPFAPAPSVDIEKATNGVDADLPTGPVLNVGDPVTWTYRVTNNGNVDLTAIDVTDDQLGAITCPATALAPDESMTCEATGIAIEGQYTNRATVIATAQADAADLQVTDEDPSHYIGIVEVPGLLGCSHGYWKNHLGEWAATPYAPTALVGDVFVSSVAFPSIANSSLLDALEFNGGPGVDGAIRNLLRQAVATLLNAAHPDVTAPYSVLEIIDLVNAAIDSDDRQEILALAGELDDANNLGCPLD